MAEIYSTTSMVSIVVYDILGLVLNLCAQIALSGHHNMKHIIALAVLLCSPLTSSAEDIRRQPLKPLKGYFPFSAPGSLEQWPQSGRQSTPSLPGAVCSLANPGPAWGVAARLRQAILEQGRIESRP